MTWKRTISIFVFSAIVPFTFKPTLGTATYTTLYSADRTSFSILVNGRPVSSTVASAFVLPGSSFELRAPAADRYALVDENGQTKTSPNALWSWTASSRTGLSSVRIQNLETNESITVNIFVMIPADEAKNGTLNGYRIGHYPKKALNNLPMYTPPSGFVEVTADNKMVRVSPHFRLGQFICKQSGAYPKYVVLQERLLEKLESLLSRTNQAGLGCETFTVMSGYRTPYYNRSLGNVAYSRHQWGDAADIFIDQNPPDGVMDDLNGDGKIDKSDSLLLARLVSDLDAADQDHLGGVGTYRSTRSHGPFVHIDARGVSRTW